MAEIKKPMGPSSVTPGLDNYSERFAQLLYMYAHCGCCLYLPLMPVNLRLSHMNPLLLEKPISFSLSVHEIGSADLLRVYDIVIRSIILQSILAKIYRLRQTLNIVKPGKELTATTLLNGAT
jgi:hypothetical protein